MGVAHDNDDGNVAHPEVFTLHWEGPRSAIDPEDVEFPASGDDESARDSALERELAQLRRSETGRALWDQIEREAAGRGDTELWRRKLHAYAWVKMYAQGTAGEYAHSHSANHATVRSWISDVAKLAYRISSLTTERNPPGFNPLLDITACYRTWRKPSLFSLP